uniref:Uncharacterized protein n=1 Tax=Arundo donax TaxID=35708 RepID=A0A0A9B592_ARUDO
MRKNILIHEPSCTNQLLSDQCLLNLTLDEMRAHVGSKIGMG